jgi:hypothetical protein
MELMSPAELRQDVARALAGGLAVAIHAIGDRACRSALDAFEAAGEALRRPALPSRIEHLQLVDESDLRRLARLGIAASVQPTHLTSDIELVERWWSGRRARAYPYRALSDARTSLLNGAAWPAVRTKAEQTLRSNDMIRLEYFELADMETLQDGVLKDPGNGILLIAAYVGTVRLIDNVSVNHQKDQGLHGGAAQCLRTNRVHLLPVRECNLWGLYKEDSYP